MIVCSSEVECLFNAYAYMRFAILIGVKVERKLTLRKEPGLRNVFLQSNGG